MCDCERERERETFTLEDRNITDPSDKLMFETKDYDGEQRDYSPAISNQNFCAPQ